MQKSVSKSGLSVVAALAAACAFASPWAAAESGPLVINSKVATVECSGRDVNVLAKDASLTLTGNCKEIHFLGAGTTATVASATLVQITADDVVVKVSGVVNEANLFGKNAELVVAGLNALSLNGENALVTAQSIGTIAAAGSGNSVTWHTGSPDINDIGGDNNFAAIP